MNFKSFKRYAGILAVLVAIPLLFQNCMQNRAGSYSINELPVPFFPGTDTGNAGDSQQGRVIIAASSVASALCTHAESCFRGVEFQSCYDELMKVPGIPELLGKGEIETLEELRQQEIARTVQFLTSRVSGCVEEIFAHACTDVADQTASSLAESAYEPLKAWISGTCHQMW